MSRLLSTLALQNVSSMDYRIQQMGILPANLNVRFKQENESENSLRVTPLEVWEEHAKYFKLQNGKQRLNFFHRT